VLHAEECFIGFYITVAFMHRKPSQPNPWTFEKELPVYISCGFHCCSRRKFVQGCSRKIGKGIFSIFILISKSPKISKIDWIYFIVIVSY